MDSSCHAHLLTPACLCPTPAHPQQRNLFLAADAEARLARTQRRQLSGSKASSKDGPRERPARAEDVVRLYDTLIANGETGGMRQCRKGWGIPGRTALVCI